MSLSLSQRLVVLVVVATVVAVLVTGLAGWGAVDGLSRLAQQQAEATLNRESELRILEQGRALTGLEQELMDGVQDAVQALSGYVSWLYERPGYFASPLEGGGELHPTAEGHLASPPGSPVGVFVPRVARPLSGIWQEVALLALVDPLLGSSIEQSPVAVRAWVVSATGAVRVYPNPGFGDPDSSIEPGYDPRQERLYAVAADPPATSADQLLWSEPYAGPGTRAPWVAAVAPVRDFDGVFRAVVGIEAAVRLPPEFAETQRDNGYALVVDGAGRVIHADPKALLDLALPADPDGPGEMAWRALPLAESAIPAVQGLAAVFAEVGDFGSLRFSGATGERFAVLAPLGVTGLSLVWSVPAESLVRPASDVAGQIDLLRRRYGAGLLAAMLLIGASLAALGSLAGRSLAKPLAALAEDVRLLGDDVRHRVGEDGPPEVAQLGREINRMAGAVATAQAAAVDAAMRADEDRRARLLAVLAERNRFAGEIHDTIAQDLAGVTIQLDNATELLAAGERQGALTAIERAASLARQGLAGARRAVWNLRPRALAQDGLVAALKELAKEHAQDGKAVSLCLDERVQVAAEVEDALFRVAQEALANVFRHSGETSATLVLAMRSEVASGEERALVELVVSDEGRGFDPESVGSERSRDDGGGFGLWAMAERVASAGGQLTVASAPGRGTTISARVLPKTRDQS